MAAVWPPAAGADIYIGHDRAGGLVLSDAPFDGVQQVHPTPPSAPAAMSSGVAAARPAGPAAAAPLAVDGGDPPAAQPPAAKFFLRED